MTKQTDTTIMKLQTKRITYLKLNVLLFTAFLILGNYQCNGQTKSVPYEEIEQIRDSLNSFLYLYKGKPFTGVANESYENGQLKREVVYKNGKWNGVYKIWHENGQLKSESTYKYGIQGGVPKDWHDNGQLKLIWDIKLKDGLPNGVMKSWYKNGQLEEERTVKDGKKDGIWNKLLSSKESNKKAA